MVNDGTATTASVHRWHSRWSVTMAFTVAFLTVLACQPTRTQPVQPKINDGDASFQSVFDLNQPGFGESLRGATVADSSQWKASFYAKGVTSLGVEKCTAALVGPHVLLTAAHCVGNDKNATIVFNGQPPISGPCKRDNQFVGEASADYALCFLPSVVPVPYETISVSADDVDSATMITLTGFGCTEADGTGGNDNLYRIGDAKVFKLPGQERGEPNSIITDGEVALCLGDSGGPAFVVNHLAASRKVVGVNSRASKTGQKSYISSVTTKSAADWIVSWKGTTADRQICGLAPNPAGCR